MGLIYNNNFHKITFFISTEIAYKILYNNLCREENYGNLKKKRIRRRPVDEEETCEKRGRDVVESVILKECVGCRENQKCQFTLADKDRLGQIIEKQGGLSYADLKRCHPCKNGQDFIEEANKIYERELFLRAMRNQMKQLRKIVGEQYIRAGNTLGDFFQGKVSLTADNKKLYEKITKGFAKSQLRLKEIYFYDNPEIRRLPADGL